MKHILVLTECSARVASARARIYSFIPLLERDGWLTRTMPVHRDLGNGGSLRERLARRLLPIAVAGVVSSYDVLLVHRFFPSNPAVTHWLRRRAKRLVFDLDESYHVDHLGRPVSGKILQHLNLMIELGDRTIVSNRHLAEYARQCTDRVSVIPTTVEPARYPIKRHCQREPIVIGWIGSGGAQEYLARLETVFDRLYARYGERVVLEIVTSRTYRPVLRTRLPIRHVEWSLDRETDFFRDFDIGIMPLTDNERSRGKAAYKALQYMASSLPVVASPVGMNREVIEPGVNGYLPDTDDEWLESLCALIDDEQRREAMGVNGRRLADQFALERWYPRFREAVTGQQTAAT